MLFSRWQKMLLQYLSLGKLSSSREVHPEKGGDAVNDLV